MWCAPIVTSPLETIPATEPSSKLIVFGESYKRGRASRYVVGGNGNRVIRFLQLANSASHDLMVMKWRVTALCRLWNSSVGLQRVEHLPDIIVGHGGRQGGTYGTQS